MNCPWWKNGLKAESCTTGTSVRFHLSCVKGGRVIIVCILVVFLMLHIKWEGLGKIQCSLWKTRRL